MEYWNIYCVFEIDIDGRMEYLLCFCVAETNKYQWNIYCVFVSRKQINIDGIVPVFLYRRNK